MKTARTGYLREVPTKQPLFEYLDNSLKEVKCKSSKSHALFPPSTIYSPVEDENFVPRAFYNFSGRQVIIDSHTRLILMNHGKPEDDLSLKTFLEKDNWVNQLRQNMILHHYFWYEAPAIRHKYNDGKVWFHPCLVLRYWAYQDINEAIRQQTQLLMNLSIE
jgi:hypothetical protein